MRYAVIENDKVVNIVISDPEYAQENGWIECSNTVGIGWTFDGKGECVPPLPDAEEEAARVRLQRDALLTESDIMVFPDRWATMTSEQQHLWSSYRQSLREITMQTGFPWNVEWPTKPSTL